ncbi:MAG: hypothetical protein ACRDRI_21870 [Pseudonocardiaceae bacterium]
MVGSGAMLVHDVRIFDGVEVIPPGGYPWTLVERGVYPPFPTLSRPEETAGFVRDRVAEGSEVVAALVAAAHNAGRLAVAHVSTRADAALAVEAGVDVLAHAFVDAPADAEFVAAAVRAGVAVVATLAMLEGAERRRPGAGGGPAGTAVPRRQEREWAHRDGALGSGRGHRRW